MNLDQTSDHFVHILLLREPEPIFKQQQNLMRLIILIGVELLLKTNALLTSLLEQLLVLSKVFLQLSHLFCMSLLEGLQLCIEARSLFAVRIHCRFSIQVVSVLVLL